MDGDNLGAAVCGSERREPRNRLPSSLFENWDAFMVPHPLGTLRMDSCNQGCLRNKHHLQPEAGTSRSPKWKCQLQVQCCTQVEWTLTHTTRLAFPCPPSQVCPGCLEDTPGEMRASGTGACKGEERKGKTCSVSRSLSME